MRREILGLIVGAGLAGGCSLSGCKSAAKDTTTGESSEALNTGLASLQQQGASGASNEWLEQASVDLKEALKHKRERDQSKETMWARADTGTAPGGGEPAVTPPADPGTQPANTSTPPANSSAPAFGLANALVANQTTSIEQPAGTTAPTETTAATPPPAPAETAEQRSARVFDEFRSLVAERGATSGSWRDFFIAAAVPAVAAPTPTPVAIPGNAPSNLGPRELASLDAALKLFEELTTGAASNGDPAAVSEAVARAQHTLDPQQQVRVPAAVLCSKVMGYGRYEAFTSNVFPAGVANRAILYVEVDRMSHRAPQASDPGLTTGDQWAVEVSQELELRLDGDPTLQWRRAEETAIETSRNKRRDFYLIQEIELPPTLSVGTYQLKVIMRDKAAAGGSSSATAYPQAEAIVEFKIAADPSAGR